MNESNAFINQSTQPSDADLEKALGSAKPVWDGLIADLAAQHGVSNQEWKCYSVKNGWSLRQMRGKRTIVWLSPCTDCFLLTFILGDKAMLAARQSKLPARVLRILEESPRYPEGTGVRLLVKGAKDISTVRKLAAVKIAN